MAYRPPTLETPKGFLEDAVEWAIEDQARYERLSGSKVGTDAGMVDSGGRPLPKTVVTLVLEVSRSKMQTLTNALRHVPNMRAAAYLVQAAGAADETSDMKDDALRMETRVYILENILINALAALDHTDRKAANAFRDQVAVAPKAKYNTMKHIVADLREAVHEKKAEVAAKLLSSIRSDDDF